MPSVTVVSFTANVDVFSSPKSAHKDDRTNFTLGGADGDADVRGEKDGHDSPDLNAKAAEKTHPQGVRR